MATTKKRINITLSDELDRAVKAMAKRDHVPQATKITRLVEEAVELHEDKVLTEIATERDTDDAEFVEYKDVLDPNGK